MPEQLKPDFQVFDNGTKIKDDVKGAVIQITVDDRIDQAAVATVELRDDECRHSTGKIFKVGSSLKIELGYVGATKVVFNGEITGIKGAFPRRGPGTFTVIGMDKFHRLRRNRRVIAYLQQKDSDIASTVAGKAGLSCEADATTLQFDHIMQVNQTDADFLLERAKLYGYEVFVEESKLKF